MPKTQALTLTWTGKGAQPGGEPRLRAEFAFDPQRADSPLRCYEASPSVCHDLRCGCSAILLQWQPVASPAAQTPPPCEFWFDLKEKASLSTPELEKDPEALRLAETLRAELTDSQQQQLYDWFRADKLALIQSTPSDEIDIADLPDAGNGRMVGFVDVFPCGLALHLTLNGETWAVDEQYCVQPRCTCKETVLSFLRLRNPEAKLTQPIRDYPALRYNYQSHTTKPVSAGPAGSPPLAQLLAALKDQQPLLDAQLQLRHLLLQNLYLRQAITRLEALTQAPRPFPAVRAKIGRNDPCPCGSGRKYKHCCLNKPQG